MNATTHSSSLSEVEHCISSLKWEWEKVADSSQLGQTHEAFLTYMLNVFLPFELAVHCDPEVLNTLLTNNIHSL